MTKLNTAKVNEVREVLSNYIDGINAITVLRERVQTAMEKVIDPSKVKIILDKKADIDILETSELISFFRVIFSQIKDDNFNPDNFIIEENKPKARSAKSANGKKEYKAIHNNNVFHPKFKDKFLSEHRVNGKPYAEETKRVAIALFGKVGKIENYYKKDVYEFDNNQFEEVLMSLKATTLRSLQNSISTLEQYIDFAIKEGRVPKDIGNIASRYNSSEVIDPFLDKKAEENMIFTKEEIDALSGYAENVQDGVILSLIFDGVSHKRKFLELRKIRIQDVDLDDLVINIPALVDEDSGEELPPRQVPISIHTRSLIKEAMKEDMKYISIGGKTRRSYKVAESDFILRGLRDNFQIKWENVHQRIIRIAKTEGYDYLNATNISYSGQIHYARELMKGGMPIDEVCDEIVKRFNLNETESKSAQFYLKQRIEKANQILGKI